MNTQRFERFSRPQFLQQVGRGRLTQMLLPHSPELMAHGIVLPAPALPDATFYLVLAALPQMQAQLSEGLREVMLAIEVMGSAGPEAPWLTPLVVLATPLEWAELQAVEGEDLSLTPIWAVAEMEASDGTARLVLNPRFGFGNN